jgi:3-deoxy-D-manno-octulosonate 8-phosphate phosphatase KdsC-like HAD superfamily phosphatase
VGLTKVGGDGAVREAIDLLLNSKGLMEKIVASMIA